MRVNNYSRCFQPDSTLLGILTKLYVLHETIKIKSSRYAVQMTKKLKSLSFFARKHDSETEKMIVNLWSP